MNDQPTNGPLTAKRLDVSVVIPAFNEQDNLVPLAEKFAEMFAQAQFSGEVILVDDGSVDRTAEVAQECAGRFPFWHVCHHRTNRGLTAALETGFARAQGKIFVFYPADLQYLPDDIPAMVQRINEGCDVVTGWKQGSYGLRRLVSFAYNAFSRILFPVGVHDLNSVKAFRREVIEDLTFRRDWHRYLVVMAAQAGYRIGEVKVKLYPRHSGESKFSGISRIPIGMLDLLAVKFQLSFMKKPLLFFGSLGMIMMVLGLAIGLVTIYLRFFGQGYRPLLYLVMLLGVSGIVLFAMGFLGELLISLKDDLAIIKQRLKQKPLPPEESSNSEEE